MKWPICWSSPGDTGITYTLQPPDIHTTHTHAHTRLYHMLQADTHLPPLLLTLPLSLCICLTLTPFFLFSLGFPFMCLPSALSEAFYCVTHTDSMVPHLCCAFAAAHRQGCCFCLSTCHPMPCTKCLSLQVTRLKIFLFATPKLCQ